MSQFGNHVESHVFENKHTNLAMWSYSDEMVSMESRLESSARLDGLPNCFPLFNRSGSGDSARGNGDDKGLSSPVLKRQ